VYLSWFAKPPPKIAVLRNPRIGQFANSCGWLSTSRGITRCRAGGAEHLTLLKLVGVEEVAGPCGHDLEDLGVLASRAGRRGGARLSSFLPLAGAASAAAAAETMPPLVA